MCKYKSTDLPKYWKKLYKISYLLMGLRHHKYPLLSGIKVMSNSYKNMHSIKLILFRANSCLAWKEVNVVYDVMHAKYQYVLRFCWKYRITINECLNTFLQLIYYAINYGRI